MLRDIVVAHTDFYQPNLALVISGPSGSGKSTVVNALCQADETLRLTISATTRSPRPGEADGVDYHFLSKAEFENQIQQDGFLEWAEYGGNFYGTLKTEIAAAQNAGQDAVLEIEVQGALQVRERVGETSTARSLLIFVIPATFAHLEKRLRDRKTESESELTQRLNTATSEIAQIQHYDYCVINHDGGIQQTVAQIQAIIAAERCRIDAGLAETIHQRFQHQGNRR